MRLENKMNKWLKYIIKLLPFIWILILFFGAIGSSMRDSGSQGSFLDNLRLFFMHEEYDIFLNQIFDAYNSNTPWGYMIGFVDCFFLDFNEYLVQNIFPGSVFGYTIVYFFEYWILIDFIDLIFSAFRFIIDICRSWLDSFYDKNKGGYK